MSSIIKEGTKHLKESLFWKDEKMKTQLHITWLISKKIHLRLPQQDSPALNLLALRGQGSTVLAALTPSGRRTQPLRLSAHSQAPDFSLPLL